MSDDLVQALRDSKGWPTLGHAAADRIREQRDLLNECEQTLLNATAHLIAAVSLLECGGKKAAPSDKMFSQMLLDYKGSISASRATLAKLRSQEKTDE